ncbi:ArsR/SmtB family transcription factor [Actinotalea fermentans]|uniref:Transcriptional regulator n=1 Tax=Actinotalea fermentans TaxID=43671 RepID=A0A511YZT5_9CELL|nr:winged helix-turn-helix domain-containing protein [Actinotalea fermentans]KGM16870.1 hypothetical protein N867_14550 [Actinotalea fermentans ATCC 43279 = JCM 9966 = DSM 3133]GEN80727.1 transcriptional regulator [Actinotalea fermentans]
MPDDAPTTPAITDPSRIRALAHPLRLELLDFLGDVGEATATQCAEHTGETVANCSFHLRTLAKAGFIEPAPSRGREKPWRPVTRSRTLDVDPADPTSFIAMSELVGLVVTREADRVRSFMATHPDRPDEWRDTVSVTTSTFWATADEMRELVEAVTHLTDRFAGRTADPSLRPEGARLGRLFATVNPDSFPDETGPEHGTAATHETTEDRP